MPDTSTSSASAVAAISDLALVRRFARHATIATTVAVYGHLETEDLIRGMRRAGDCWNGSAEITLVNE